MKPLVLNCDNEFILISFLLFFFFFFLFLCIYVVFARQRHFQVHITVRSAAALNNKGVWSLLCIIFQNEKKRMFLKTHHILAYSQLLETAMHSLVKSAPKSLLSRRSKQCSKII